MHTRAAKAATALVLPVCLHPLSVAALPRARSLHCGTAPLAAASVAAQPAAAPSAAAPSGKKAKVKKSELKVSAGRFPGWEVVIGIEVHAQVVARSKLFSPASTRFGAAPNANASAVDAALPGTLPVLNAHAVAQAARTGLGLGGEVQVRSAFERKHYFYCDMPQGYQITQQQFPIVRGGALELDSQLSNGERASVRITRIQLEQDSGKNVHDLHPSRTYVDLNRAGVGLMEIVSEPDMRSSEQAAAYIRKLTQLLQHLGTCRAHMEDGSLRCDVNISVRREGATPDEYGERVEVKNLNSIRSLQRAIEHEFARQVALAQRGEPVRRETRAFDAKSGATVLMRTKEQMLDYRFAPEPDLPPLILSPTRLEQLRLSMPELPDAIAARFRDEYGLSAYDIGVLTAEAGAPAYLDALVWGVGPDGEGSARRTDELGHTLPGQSMKRKPKTCANWLTSELFGRLKKRAAATAAAEMRAGMGLDEDGYPDEDVEAASTSAALADDDSSAGSFAGAGQRAPTLASSPVGAARLGELVDLVESGTISGKVGKDLLDLMLLPEGSTAPEDADVHTKPLEEVVRARGWAQVVDAALLDSACSWVLSTYPAEVQQAQRGNKRITGFLQGQVLKKAKETGGQLNPAAVSKRIAEMIAALPPPPAA